MGTSAPGRVSLKGSLPFLALALAILFSGESLAQVDGTLQFNEQFLGMISSVGDEDVVQFQEAAGSRITITVTAQSGNQLKPSLELLDDQMAVIDVGSKLTESGKVAEIKKYLLAQSGVYYARVGSRNGLTGTYSVKITGSVKKEFKSTANLGLAGEVDDIVFDAREDAKLSGTVKRTSGDLIPAVVELAGPNGVLVAIAGKTSLNKGETKLKLKNITLPFLGTYRLRITGQGGTTGDYKASLKVVPAKPIGGKVYEDEYPGGTPGGPGFTLTEVLFGRGLKTAEGLSMEVVSPLTTVATDPISDLPVAGTLKPLFETGSVKELINFNLGPLYGPPVVPRNAVFVLRFTAKPSLESLALDADNALTQDSPIQVSVNGEFVPMQVFIQGTDVVLNPVVRDEVGLPASPLSVDSAGNPTASLTGAGQLTFVSKGDDALMNSSGGKYKPRSDLLGSVDAGGVGIGFNPGNLALDFFKQNAGSGGGISFGGFLPDLKAPRLVREKTYDGQYAPNYAVPSAGDQFGPASLSLVLDTAFNIFAKDGKGEWATGVLRLRPSGPNREEHVIERNLVTNLGNGYYRNEIQLVTKIVIPLAQGQDYQLVRAEYFEPDLNNPIDPELYDPNNPELTNNTVFRNFVEARDRNGDLQDVNGPVDPLSTFTFRFSEPMQIATFKPYESFYVSDYPKINNYGLNYVGRVAATSGGKVMTFRPEREVQFGAGKGTFVPLALSRTAAALSFHIISVPPADVLQGLLGPTAYKEFVKEGARGITDVGGQPLAFALSDLSAQNRIIDYNFDFSTFEDLTQVDSGAVVQRFLGAPQTGFGTGGTTGIKFRDVPIDLAPGGNLYGPRIADLNLFTNGFLSGAPVQFFTKIHDDFNPPPTGQFGAFPFGTSTPIGGNAVLGGARFQHVFRAVDASPDWENLGGTMLDLYHMAYAPIGGSVVNTTLPDISIHAGHSAVVPDTHQSGGIPSHTSSGLVYQLNTNYNAVELSTSVSHSRQLVAGDDMGGGSYTGVAFEINNEFLFSPLGTQHNYHPIPDQAFNHPFAYNNGALDQKNFQTGYGSTITWPQGAKKTDYRPESLLIEYRVRVKDANNPPANQNGFTFAVGVLSSAVPRFRAFSFGSGCMICCPGGGGSSSTCKNACTIAYGPVLDGLPNNGGPPLEPDTIVNAGGPAPAPPSLYCVCLRAPQNHGLPPGATAGCIDTALTQTITSVAYGAANPSNNNFGDNSRYFMVFNYVKKESYLISPLIQVQPTFLTKVTYQAPIFDPPLDAMPQDTGLDVRFRSSSTATGGTTVSPWVTPQNMVNTNNALNTPAQNHFIQFDAAIEANTTTQLVPVFDDIVVPFVVGGT